MCKINFRDGWMVIRVGAIANGSAGNHRMSWKS